MKKFQHIVLYDSTCDFEDVKEFLINNTVITLDYNSHKLLEKEKISHKTSDDFLTTKLLKKIECDSYRFSKWCDEFKNSFLIYDEINIANLFYREFHYFLVPFLKNFFEIKEIFSKFGDSIYFISEDKKLLIQCFTNNLKVIKSKPNFSEKTAFDSIKYDVNIFGKSFPIRLSKKKYGDLKKISELFWKLILSNNKKQNDSTIMLVEFDTVRFKDLLIESKNSKINFLLYNRRRPTIWNVNSFSTIKNSGCQISSTINFTNEKKNII